MSVNRLIAENRLYRTLRLGSADRGARVSADRRVRPTCWKRSPPRAERRRTRPSHSGPARRTSRHCHGDRRRRARTASAPQPRGGGRRHQLADGQSRSENRPSRLSSSAGNPLERTLFWEQGAQLVRGDQLDITGLFGGDVLVVDVADVSLRRFLVDLPAHTVPTARILGPLTISRTMSSQTRSIWPCAMTPSSATSRDLLDVTGTWTLSDARRRCKAACAAKTCAPP